MLFKRTFFLFLFGLIFVSSKAQTTDSLLFNRLGDFDLARFNNDQGEAIRIGEGILPDTAKLTAKGRASFFARLAKLYEDTEQETKAIIYYQKVVVLVPDYYVAQRALGYMYDSAAEEIHLKLYQTKNDDPVYRSLFDSYKAAVLKALPHLEKAQACDPNDETLELIRTLYQNIHDEKSLNSLNSRLKNLNKNCIDILNDN